MRVRVLSSLILAALCLLASLDGSNADCCTTMANLEFTITNGNCGVVNAKKTVYGCSATVCGDGTILAGMFCGHGPCNVFGCNCMGGCRHGNFGQSFLARNQDLGIILMSSEIVNHGPRSNLWSSVIDSVTSYFPKR